MALRERRLASDAQTIRQCFGPDARIRLIAAEGDPPERYRFEYLVKSLVVQNGEVVPSPRQVVEVYLTLSYPRQAPQCRMLTPVFHPNIAPHAVCIGDHWSAGESLAALLVRMAEMLTYQSYNLQSPLNGDAAKWADEHMSELPLEEFDFGSLLAGMHTIEMPPPQGEAVPTGALDTGSEPTVFDDETELVPVRPPAWERGPIPLSPMPEDLVPPIVPGNTGLEELPAMPDVQGASGPRTTAGARVPPPGARPGPSPLQPRTAECPNCGAALSIPENLARDAWMRCPLCGHMLRP